MQQTCTDNLFETNDFDNMAKPSTFNSRKPSNVVNYSCGVVGLVLDVALLFTL